MFNKKMVQLLLLSLIFIFITACGGGSSPKADDNKKSGESSELSGKITFWTLQLSPDFDDYINGVITKFEAMHPGVEVVWEDIPFDQAEQKTLTAASAGNLADVMNLNTDYLKKLASVGALVNMDEAAVDVKEDFFPGIWSAGEVDGTSYALPWYVSSGGLLYNKELLEKAGFDSPPTTEKEAWEMSKVIKEKTGAYGNVVDPTDVAVYRRMPLDGIPLVSEDLTKAAFNTPEGLAFIKEYKQYYDDGLIPKEILLGQVEVSEWYAQEKVAWWATGPALFRHVQDLAPDVYEKSEAAPAIVGELGKLHTSIMNITVSTQSKNKEVAVEFAKFVTNAENILEFCKLVSILPPVIEAAEDEFFVQGENSDDPMEKGRYLVAQDLEKSENVFPPVEEISEIHKVINEEFQRVLLENKDPKKALDDAEAKVNKLLQR